MKWLMLCAAAFLAGFAISCGDDDDDGATTPAVGASVTVSAVSTVAPTVAACPTPPAGDAADVTAMQGSSAVAVVATEVTAAGEDCKDLVTFVFEGSSLPAYDIRYVEDPTQCASGEPLTITGDAILQVRFNGAQAHDDAGNGTVEPREFAPNLASVKEVKLVCDFEGELTFLIGTAERHFTVTQFSGRLGIAVEIAR